MGRGQFSLLICFFIIFPLLIFSTFFISKLPQSPNCLNLFKTFTVHYKVWLKLGILRNVPPPWEANHSISLRRETRNFGSGGTFGLAAVPFLHRPPIPHTGSLLPAKASGREAAKPYPAAFWLLKYCCAGCLSPLDFPNRGFSGDRYIHSSCSLFLDRVKK